MGEIINVSVDVGENSIDFEIRYEDQTYHSSMSIKSAQTAKVCLQSSLHEIVLTKINFLLRKAIDDYKAANKNPEAET